MQPEELQTLIRESRKAARLTQQELADLVGVTKFTVNQFETGKQNITVDTLCRMLNVLHIELRQIPEASWLAYQQIISLAKEL